MRKKTKQAILTRFRTDIVSRYKLGWKQAHLEETFQQCRASVELRETEFRSFVQSVEDAVYELERGELEEALRRNRLTSSQVRLILPRIFFPTARSRLQIWLRERIREEDEALFQTHRAMFAQFLLDPAVTLEDIQQSLPSIRNVRVRGRLYELVQQWVQDKKASLNNLERMAKDAQNIHTLAVNTQTEDMLTTLRAVSVLPSQKTMSEILSAWEHIDETIRLRVELDMRAWARKSYIVREGDYLYRNTLRSVWANIQSYSEPTRKELCQRLWEECYESLGMCAQGHISRLVNVFVGFHDGFRNVESIQDVMAKLSQSDMCVEEKLREAVRYMEGRKMAVGEQSVWLDALRG